MKKFLGVLIVIAIVVIAANVIHKQPAQPAAVTTKTINGDTKDSKTLGTRYEVELPDGKTVNEKGQVVTASDTARKTKIKYKFWCVDNGDGTVTYGTATKESTLVILGIGLGGHWDYGVGITIPGDSNTCKAFLDGVNS